MKRKQKHYSTEQQIIDKIDKARADANGLNKEAELKEEMSKSVLQESQKLLDKWSGKTGETADMNLIRAHELKSMFWTYREQAVRCRKQARRIEEVKLPSLGDALSEFRTQPIVPILGDDSSVASLV